MIFYGRNSKTNFRPAILENVQKAIDCGNEALGYTQYYCEDCDKLYKVGFTCKSTFCTSCGIKYQMDRALSISEKLIDCKHRHVVFTPPEKLRKYFKEYPELQNALFEAARDTILFFFKNINKSKNFEPGIIMVLHTFGRPLNWNPHIHALVTEGGSSKNSKLSSDAWRSVTHFNYNSFRKSFQKQLLDHMQAFLKKRLDKQSFRNFKNLVNYMYINYKDGFYVSAKPDYRDGHGAIKYLIRYFNRPAIASSRILYYDGEYIVYYYQRHQDGKYILIKEHVDEFIKKLIRHIPEKNFKMLRYAGLYASNNKCSHLKNLKRKLSSLCISIMKKKANWRDRIIANFNRDPLICPHCKKLLRFFDYYVAPRSP